MLDLDPADVLLNMQNFLFAPSASGEDGGFHVQHLMIDDVACEKRRRPSPHDGKTRGYGRESDASTVTTFEVRSVSNLEEMKAAEEAGKLVLSQEVTVYAIGANSEKNSNIYLIGASGTAKKGMTSDSLERGIALCVSTY